VEGARGLQGVVSRMPVLISVGTQVSFFRLAPEHGGAARWIQMESLLGRERSSVLFAKTEVPSLERTFEFKGLDEGETYVLSLEPQNNWARTRGGASEVVSSVVCVGSHPSALGPELRPVLIPVGSKTNVHGVNTLACGFLDEDPADNQGQAVVHVSLLNRPSPPVGTAPSGTGVSMNADEAGRLVRDADQLVRSGQYREGEQLLRKCLALDPMNAQCHLILGVACAKLGRFEEAATAYRKVLELSPNHPAAATLRKIVDQYDKSQGRQ
jgi:eukaryotic-like serine/threonine-protein kinase